MSGQHVKEYLQTVVKKFQTEHAREHAYRPALNSFFEVLSGLNVVNDPKKSQYGAPDFVFLKNKSVISYAEAKDLDVSLDETVKSEQMGRYYGYSSLILTNGLEFRFYRNGEPYGDPIIIGQLKDNAINPAEASFVLLEDTIKNFLSQAREPITSGKVLSKVMAGKARRIRDNIKVYLKSADEQKNENLLSVYNVIKKLLLADLDSEKFADMYAQTLVYGLFVARYSDPTQGTFSRQEARDLIPASNPFLRHFFDHIAGTSFDPRIEVIVNELCEEFTHADVNAIVHDYFKTGKDQSRDPIIHFYEDFLKEYNPTERMELGVFYTPLPVVRFIVRSLDEILKKDFGLLGLSDNSKITINHQIQSKKFKKEIAKVQILDPATGTGTFLNETIQLIKQSFLGQEGRWAGYVKDDLLPRLHGFELMMAPYTIAHLKLASTLKETGAEIKEGRIGIYLTNSLEKTEIAQRDLFSIGLGKAIAEESHQADRIKNELPIMVVLGNPPYSGESMNPGYTDNNVYKFEPGTTVKLQERNSKWINDDYVKFIRFSESMIEKTGEGVVGMITAHGYLDNPTFRGMRYHLMQTFDSLYVFDLHGNANKKEVTASGGLDKNVFDIKQGVAILLGIKKRGKSKKLAQVFRFDLQGSREEKFEFLDSNSINSLPWKKVDTNLPNYEFVFRDSKVQSKYADSFSVNELFSVSSVGIVTARDAMSIQFRKEQVEKVVDDFNNLDAETLREKYNLGKDVRDWKVNLAKKDVMEHYSKENIVQVSYRPFDDRWTFYTGNSKGFHCMPRGNVMKNFISGKNLALVSVRQVKAGDSYQHIFVSNKIVESTLVSNKTSEIDYVLPLYVYEKDGKKFPNFNKDIYNKIVSGFTTKAEPENILDYIYGVLYSPKYREEYKAFLKIDFPRVPYPKSEQQFFELAKLGQELRKLHLLESEKLDSLSTSYPESGNNIVDTIEYKQENVYINKTQYFGGVAKDVWEFTVGCYQPLQKWLKDRKGQTLDNSDIEHYQKMISAISETLVITKNIDSI